MRAAVGLEDEKGRGPQSGSDTSVRTSGPSHPHQLPTGQVSVRVGLSIAGVSRPGPALTADTVAVSQMLLMTWNKMC